MISGKTLFRMRRILAMVPWAMDNPYSPVEEVAKRFEYENEEELIKDIELLAMCGLPGYGPEFLIEAYIHEGGVVIETSDYLSQPLPLHPVEALVLLSAAMTVMDTSASTPALESAVRKLSEAVFLKDSGAFLVDLPDQPEEVEKLQEAISSNQVVEMTYLTVSRNEQTTRQVEPWSVVSSGGFWYLTAFCRTAQAHRTFRVDRVREMVVLDNTFAPPTAGQLGTLGFVPSEESRYATIGLAPEARWVVDFYPVEIVEDTPEELVIRFAYRYPRVPTRLLIKLSKSARLIEGDEVAEDMQKLTQAIIARYENRSSNGRGEDNS